MGKVSVREIEMPVHMYSIKCPFYMTNPEGITVHNTANDASAENEVRYMQENFKQISYHIAVDDKEAVLGVPLNRNAWHAGDGNGKGNRKTIAVEICYSLSGGERFIKAEKNAAALIAEMLKERGWGIDRVYKHQDWFNKNCPHRTISMGWDRFLDMIRDELKLLGVVEKADETETSKDEEFEPYIVKVTTYRLNFRSAPGTHGKAIGQIKQDERYTIVDEENGWGLLKSYAKNRNGWINLDYTAKV